MFVWACKEPADPITTFPLLVAYSAFWILSWTCSKLVLWTFHSSNALLCFSLSLATWFSRSWTDLSRGSSLAVMFLSVVSWEPVSFKCSMSSFLGGRASVVACRKKDGETNLCFYYRQKKKTSNNKKIRHLTLKYERQIRGKFIHKDSLTFKVTVSKLYKMLFSLDNLWTHRQAN